MALRLGTREVTWALLLLWCAAAAITVGMLRSQPHDMSVVHFGPVVILTVVLAVWPFALGWRPFTPSAQHLRTCAACGVQWRPADEGTTACPACGA